jgi:excisionase family DNA binding protein
MSLPDVRYLTVAEVADAMGVSRLTVYRLVHSGDLPAMRFDGSFRVPEWAVEDALRGSVSEAS